MISYVPVLFETFSGVTARYLDNHLITQKKDQHIDQDCSGPSSKNADRGTTKAAHHVDLLREMIKSNEWSEDWHTPVLDTFGAAP